MKIYIFLTILFPTAYNSYAEENHKNSAIKSMIMREIMKKMSNITLNSLSKVTDEKKEMVLNKIEQKLRKTAVGLTDGQKYVKYIMEEFKNKAYNSTQPQTKKQIKTKVIEDKSTEMGNSKQEKDVLRTVMDSKEGSLETSNSVKSRKIFKNLTKEHIIKDISNKIESMAKGYLRESQTFEQKQKIFQKIKQRIVDSSKRKHMLIHNQHNELKAYTNLITEGLELSMKKLLLQAKARRMDDDRERDEKETVEHKEIFDNKTYAINMAHINEYKTFFAELFNETSIDPRCNAIVEEICYRIGSLHKFSCGDGKVISLEQLCDDASDCWNGVDETNCTTQAMEKSRLAVALMSDIDQSFSRECFQPILQNSMFSFHHQIVRDMLEEQLRLLKKYEKLKTTGTSEDEENESFIKNLITDITRTVSSLSDTFDVNLCSPRDEATSKANISRKSIDPDAIEDFVDDPSPNDQTWLPKSCTCKNQFCKITNCDTRCKRICWQKYSLNQWQCQAITGGSSISIDLICDGKLDCFDETDEASCTTDSTVTKYEANAIYRDLLEILSLKSLSMEFEPSRNKIIAETNSVRQLQKLTIKSYVDVHAVKIARDEYFKTLSQIYGDLLQTSNLAELDNIYEYLRVLNEKMVTALKLSHTGNEHVVAPAGCYCNNGTCALIRCSRRCIQTCLIEPTITKYSCKDNNTSVTIKAVCNGKNDCPNEEDEKDCQKEVCRAHHLVVLRHNLQRAGVLLKGSYLGDVLDSWKSKVMSSLIIAQGSERPNHKMLQDIVIKVLRDLVSTYAAMEETKKSNNDFIVNEFINMSSIVKQTLKYCDK